MPAQRLHQSRIEPAEPTRSGVSKRNIRLRAVIEDIVGSVFGVDATALRQPTRGRANAALARQVAMYVAHTAYGLTLTEVGDSFERDRTTVAHACAIVEQRREDTCFDAALVLIENIVRAINGPLVLEPQSDASGWSVTSHA